MATPESRIAVIGMACRLPGGVDDPEGLWSLLAEGRDGRKEVPKDRWDWKSFYNKNPDTKDATNFSHAYFLDDDVSAFDARFFGISGADAATIDPQHRFLLEVTYEALEDAGLTIEGLRGSDTSVHMAMFARDYDRMGYKDMAQADLAHIIGAGEAILSNRISYVLDLKGSSNTLDTGCSGGLVALHQACQTLRTGESTVALAGASQLLLSPDQSIAMSQLTNKDGRSYTFDDRGAGYARGEGLGVLALKRLDRAVADGDQIHAVVVDSGAGHDGKTSGIFLPNPDAQESLARSVYARAGLDPRETLFVESHGTGTVAGDNAEVGSIAKVFGREAGRTSDLPIGSIKTNIGHLEAASGVAGAIKAIMVLKKNQIPPQLNFSHPKDGLRLQERGLKVPLELTPLTPQGHTGPRRVSINSFGYGGANAHAILEGYDAGPTADESTNGNGCLASGNECVNGNGNVNDDDPVASNGDHGYGHSDVRDHEAEEKLIVLSANSESSLRKVIANMRQWLASGSGESVSMEDLAYTLNTRRSKLPWRCSITASNLQELGEALEDVKLRPVKSSRELALAFVFTGQGAQWFAMGREMLMGTGSREFAFSIALCNQSIKALGCEWDLVEELSRDAKSSRLGEARFAQPLTTAVQIALVDLLDITYGIRPQAVCGHSSGEIAAAYATGALSRDTAMQVAYMRGICSAKARTLNATQGGMMAVGEGEEAINKRIKELDGAKGKVTVACVNSPESTTVSGDVAAVLDLEAALVEASVFNRRLKVDSAYHSHHMEAVAPSYLSSLDGLASSVPREDVAFYSSVTGARKQSGFGPSYWVSNLVSQVKFSAASQLVAQHLSDAHLTAGNLLIEVGPHAALSGPLRQSLSDSNFKLASGASFKYNYVPCLVRNTSAVTTVLALAGKVFELGGQINLDGGDSTKSSRPQRRVVGKLPSYPWDHSNMYWRESRLSRGSRLRSFPPHDLLGLFDVHSSPYEPRWTYRVSPTNIPWVRDHVVEGFVIFPGAGYLVMAIEAMKQLFQLRKTPGRITNINFRDVTFDSPVVIHDDGAKESQERELQLIISPSRQHAGSPWEHFRVISYDAQNDAWVDNCSGLVSWESAATQTDEPTGAQDDGLGHLTRAAADEWLQDVQAACDVEVDAAETYRTLKATGNEYGDTFQGLKEIRVGTGCATARIVVPNIAHQIQGHYMQPHTIHPSTLDSIFQLENVCFRREGLVAPIMTAMLEELSVAVDMDSTPDTDIVMVLKHSQKTPRDAALSYCAYQRRPDGTTRPVVAAANVQTKVVGQVNSNQAGQKKTTYRMDWQPDVDYITPDDVVDRTQRADQVETELRLNNTVATIFLCRAVQHLKSQGITTACSPQLTKLLSWMISWDTQEAGQLLERLTPVDEASLVEQASRPDNIVGSALARLGPQYFDILTGRADAADLLAHDSILERLYSEHVLFRSHHSQITTYTQVLTHKYPSMDVLVTGAGTGGATMPLMDAMERNGRLPVGSYTYADVSADHIERAREILGDRAAGMEFRTLETSRDPLAQEYTAHSFDLIVASMVSYGALRMDVTVAHLRKLLKPNGRLVLLELTATAAAHNAVFGTLEGWWASEDSRYDGPLLGPKQWEQCLQRHGFSSEVLTIPSHRGPLSDISTLFIARALPASREAAGGESQIGDDRTLTAELRLGDPQKASQVSLGESLGRSLGGKGFECSRGDWKTKPTVTVDQDNGIAIVVDSAEHPLLLDPSPEIFQQVQQFLLQGGNIIWVSFQSSPPTREKAAVKNMVSGMGRVLRRENPGLRLVTIDVQDPIQPSGGEKELQRVVEILAEVAVRSFRPPKGAEASEWKPEHEYAIRDGKLAIPRVIPDDRLVTHIDSRNKPERNTSGDASLVDCKYLDESRYLKFEVQTPGLLKSIRFVDNDDMSGALGPDEVQIQAWAHGVNAQDVLVTLGQLTPGTAMTGEMAGVITAVGSDVRTWKAGDRVAALSVAQFGNQVRTSSKNVVAIPDSVSFVDAASIQLAFFTAWYCLNQVARIEKGQSLLIHAGSSDVGQAAIQLAQLAEAALFVTVGSTAEKELIQENYGVSSDRILLASSGSFKKHVLDATRGVGVDIVINSLSGQLLRDSWDCVAPFGTFCNLDKTDVLGRGQLSMAKFAKQATFAAVDASYMHRMRPERVVGGIRDIFAMIAQGKLKPVRPVRTLDMSRIEQALSLVSEKKNMGKLVLVSDENSHVRATRPTAPSLRLQRDGTYVIGGGLGDIGKKMGRFLAEKGAGHIVALTRRDADAVAQQPGVVEAKEAIGNLGGTLHVFQCDISDVNSARRAADELVRVGLPPVKGIIQSATVLRDRPFELMGVDDWRDSVRPKVQGTMGLHEAFCSPETTEFFVMLSSVSSILGTASQSNYAAGNAFKDAFARAGKQFGNGVTNYAALNVAAVEGSDLVTGAQQQGVDIAANLGSVSFDDVLATLEYAMNPQARVGQKEAQHIMYFDRDIMEETLGPSALGDHIYDHIPSKKTQGGKASNGMADSKKQSPLQAAEHSKTVADAEETVRQALLDKFVAFTGDEIPDGPIVALGLDSLVSIELKNWVQHTFRVPLQVSELTGASSMLALAKVVVSRMKLKCNSASGAGHDGQNRQEIASAHTTTDQNGVAKKHHGHGLDCCRRNEKLPVQSLPDLDDTIDYWLESNGHLFNPEQLEAIHQDLQAMRAPESPARKILRDLYSAHTDDKTNGWFTDIVSDGRFLCRRSPIAPWTSIMGAQRDGRGARHSQAERAAIIASAAVSWRRAMNAGKIEPLEVAGRPECTWGWEWLFNSTRVPQLDCDKVVSYAPPPGDGKARDHVAVLRRGRVFKVMLQDGDGKDVPLSQLQAAFEAIVTRVGDEGVLSGLLTTDDRDSWAKIRETLSALNPGNVEYFHALDSAMFVLCLDDGSPGSPEQIARHGYIGDGTNRWFDKVLQFYVSANGRSGVITEHGILDGTAPTRLLEWIAKAMKSHPTGSNGHTGNSNPEADFSELVLQTTPEIEDHTAVLRKRYQQSTSTSTYVREQLEEFSTDFLLQSRVPVKGVIDLTFQLALRLFFGQNMISWEPTSGALFHAGRADAMQRATPAVNAFCDAAAGAYPDSDVQSDRGKLTDLKALLMAATKSINAGMQILFTGRSSQRVFEVLSHLWPKDDASSPKPAFLSDMVFFGRPSPPIFAQTHSVEGELTIEDFVHLIPDTDGLWSIICPDRNKISVSLTGGSKERTAAFVKELHRAASIMRDIVQERV